MMTSLPEYLRPSLPAVAEGEGGIFISILVGLIFVSILVPIVVD